MAVAASLFRRVVAAVLAPLLVGVAPALAQDITGAGSTFVYPVMAKWSAAYSSRGRGKVLYHPIGSGAGIAQIKSGALDFAASDAPLKPEELARAALEQFPLVIGGIVPVVNIAGVKAGDLKLTGGILADIYLGKVRRWNDPAIVSLNPGLALPDSAIMVAHRLDNSGTTFNWAYYLSKASDEWRSKVGWGTNISWVVGVGAKGNDGLAALVGQAPNSIGYVEYAYALQKKLTYAVVRNKAGNFIAPDAASFQAAATSANWAQAKNFHLMLADAPGEDAYPIAATVFALMHRESTAPVRRAAVLSFFRWVMHDGKGIASDLSYVPLPEALVACIENGTCAGSPLTSVSSSQ
jgi:phosphate transport system substrate-binding protein